MLLKMVRLIQMCLNEICSRIWVGVGDFAGQCWLWRLSSCTFVVAALGFPTNLGVGQSRLFPASSIKFPTRRSLKSWWVYLAPLEDKQDPTVEYCWIQKVEKQFHVPLEGTFTHRIAVGHMIRIADVTHVLVLPFHDMRFHRVVAVATKISFYWWLDHFSQHVNFSSVLPN